VSPETEEAAVIKNPPEGFPRITPYLLYEDVDTAADWLMGVFGFEERFRMKAPDGKAMHAELALADGVVMMGNPGPDYQNPSHRGGATQLVHVYVDDVDAHFRAATAAGAHILREPADQFYGDRTYNVEDLEGHQWTFCQHVRDVPPEDMHP
jgi:PhnB protein